MYHRHRAIKGYIKSQAIDCLVMECNLKYVRISMLEGTRLLCF